MDKVDNWEDQLAATVFEVTVASSTVQLTDRRGDASYSARNRSSRPLVATAKPVVTPPTVDKWLVVDQPERTFSPGVLEHIPVHIQVPTDAPPGTYGFRLDVAGRDNPDENFAQGPGVTFAVPPPPPPPPQVNKPFPWWIVAVAAAVALVIGGVVAFVLLRNVTTPNVVGQTLPTAQATLQAASLQVGSTTTDQVTGQPDQAVLRQNPGAATLAPRNSAVDLVVQAPPRLQPVPCSQERSLRSNSGSSTTIEFINATTETVHVSWLDYSGNRVLYNTLAPWQAYPQGTYVTHPWVVTDAAGQCLVIFVPTSAPSGAWSALVIPTNTDR